MLGARAESNQLDIRSELYQTLYGKVRSFYKIKNNFLSSSNVLAVLHQVVVEICPRSVSSVAETVLIIYNEEQIARSI